MYGSGVHRYISTMYETGGDLVKSREAALDVFRQAKLASYGSQHLLDEKHFYATCFMTWDDFIAKDEDYQLLMLPNGKPATEVNFKFKYTETEKTVVFLTGTIDRIGKIRNGCYCIADFKTTSKGYDKNKRIAFLDAFKMSKQLRFYRLAMKLMSEVEPESMLGRIGSSNLGCRIDGIFLGKSPADLNFGSSSVFMISDDTISEFRAVLDEQIRRFVRVLEDGPILREGINNGSCLSEYRCKFWDVCGAPKPVQQVMLDRDFSKRYYDPLKFGEVV